MILLCKKYYNVYNTYANYISNRKMNKNKSISLANKNQVIGPNTVRNGYQLQNKINKK